MEIKLHGIVAHVAENPDAAPGFTTQVGVFLTDTGPEWETLCRRLAAPSATPPSAPALTELPWRIRESNPGPGAYETPALTI